MSPDDHRIRAGRCRGNLWCDVRGLVDPRDFRRTGHRPQRAFRDPAHRRGEVFAAAVRTGSGRCCPIACGTPRAPTRVCGASGPADLCFATQTGSGPDSVPYVTPPRFALWACRSRLRTADRRRYTSRRGKVYFSLPGSFRMPGGGTSIPFPHAHSSDTPRQFVVRHRKCESGERMPGSRGTSRAPCRRIRAAVAGRDVGARGNRGTAQALGSTGRGGRDGIVDRRAPGGQPWQTGRWGPSFAAHRKTFDITAAVGVVRRGGLCGMAAQVRGARTW